MPTEKDVILRVSSAMSHVVCLCFDCTRLYLVKLDRLHCSSCKDIIDTSLQSIALFIK